MFLSLLPVPARRYRSVYEIDARALHRSGIRLLLLDLDNTISPYRSTLPSEELRAWIAQLQAAGIRPYILSNSRKSARVPRFAEALGIPFLRHAGKPKRAGFLRAMEEMGASPGETLMVGDQIFTDILGATRVGIRAFLVRPLRLDTPFRLIRYGIETPFRRRSGPWHAKSDGAD